MLPCLLHCEGEQAVSEDGMYVAAHAHYKSSDIMDWAVSAKAISTG